MKISSPYKLIFFKKMGCPPCAQAQVNLTEVLTENPDFGSHVATMQKENHPALVVSYDLNKYPTVLIMDEQGNEISRKVGVAFLTTEWWFSALSIIHNKQLNASRV